MGHFQSLPLLASAASFVTYAYSGHSIDASRIIPALALFNTMRLSLFLLPIAISRTLDGAAGLDAVKLYLEQPDAQKYVHIEPSMEVALRVSSASFTWNVPQARRRRRGYLMPNVDIPGNLSPPSVTASTADGFAIRIGDLEFLSGELTVIVGRVGSGKTSFLMALAGLMPKICGSVKARGKVSFCPKEPWLQSTTFRQNICFDENPRPALYRAILQACCLTEDINSFPDGDQILISGAGTSLSGGQRSRIGLARSLYEQSEIVLIDDCLSALDPKVRDHVFEQAIRGFLRHKCCIMATHDSKFASQAKTVVWLEDGEVKAVGNFYDLVQQHPTFADALGVTDSASKPGVVPQQIRSSSGFVAEQQSIVPALESAGYSPNERSTLRRFLRICLEEGSSLLWMYIALLLLSQTAYITFALWLSWWVSDALGLTTASYLIGLSLIALSQVVLLYFMSSVLVKIVTRVSRRLFDTSMRAVIFARAEFFRKNSLGTLVSIFSKNLDILDHRVIEPIRMCFIYVSGGSALYDVLSRYN